MRTIKIGDNIIIEKEADILDIIVDQARHYRDRKRGHPPKRRKLKTRSRAKEYKREATKRRKRIRAGLCSARGCSKLKDGFKMCEPCRTKWRVYNSRCAARKIFQLTDYSLSIDLD